LSPHAFMVTGRAMDDARTTRAMMRAFRTAFSFQERRGFCRTERRYHPSGARLSHGKILGFFCFVESP